MMEKGPFSLYDFMGYFFPGALALYLIVLGQNDIFSYFSQDFFKDTTKNFLELPIHMLLFYVIISYCIGHFLSFFSTLTIEKYTRLAYGDPSKNLLATEENKGQSFLKGIPLSRWRFILILLIWPLIAFDYFAVSVMGFKHKYLETIHCPYRDLVKRRITELFHNLGMEADVFNSKSNNFHQLLIHYNYEFTRYHGHKLMNYVSLYGFLRVITLISCLFCSYLIYFFAKNSHFDCSPNGFTTLVKYCLIVFSFGFMTFNFYLGYLKFYKRYTLENLMLVMIIDKESKEYKVNF